MISKVSERVPAESKERLLSGIFWRILQQLGKGHLVVSYQGATHHFGQSATETDLHARIDIHHSRALLRTITGGSIGSGEAYMFGEWTSPDVSKVVQLFFRNIEILDSLEKGFASVSTIISRVLHWLNRNTLNQAKKNISAHYDLGNDFFKTFLDPTMMYSSAIFARDDMRLEEASLAKLDRICKKLDLQPQDHLIEIGTGWGGMAIYAAKHYGCKVTTATISEQQYHYVTQKIKEKGLEDRVNVLLQDYRTLEGKFDKLVSIEMIEAVGHQYLDTYFRKCSELVKPDGLMLLQAITIKDQRYEYARDSSDFIKKYIFPGGFLPSVAVINHTVRKTTDLQMVHMEQFGQSYAQTLNHWRKRFTENLIKIESLGYSPEFIKMWEFYLASCEGGFKEHTINCAQMLFEKPDYRKAAPLGRL